MLIVKSEVTNGYFVEIVIKKKCFFNTMFFSTPQLTTINSNVNVLLLII